MPQCSTPVLGPRMRHLPQLSGRMTLRSRVPRLRGQELCGQRRPGPERFDRLLDAVQRLDTVTRRPPCRYSWSNETMPTKLEPSLDLIDGINRINAEEGVRWLYSFLSADKRKTYCLYEAPFPAAIRTAATRAGLPADVVVEVTDRLMSDGATAEI